LFGSVTAGDLIFAGGTNDRNFRAFDAKTGELLWEQKTNSGIVGMPVAYEVDGTEYIAIQSGWGVDAQRIQDALTTNNIGLENNVPQRRRGLGVRRQEVAQHQPPSAVFENKKMRRNISAAFFCLSDRFTSGR
jgi:PQQ enzyme repeat